MKLMKLLVAVLALFALAGTASAWVPCTTLRSRANEFIDLGNGNYHFVGSILEGDWAVTLRDFRRKNPDRAISDIKVRQSEYLDGCLDTQLHGITVHTTTVAKPLAHETVSKPTAVPRGCEGVAGRCLSITASPWAKVLVWRKKTPDASGVFAYPAEEGAPRGYTFSTGSPLVDDDSPLVITDPKLLGDGQLVLDFEHPAFHRVSQTIIILDPKLAYHVDLTEEAVPKVHLR